jgi:hypothetical protein
MKKQRKQIFLKRSSFMHLLPQINYPYHYTTYKFVFFFAFNNFVLGFATGQLQPQSAESRPAVPRHATAPAGCSLLRHDPG